MPGFMSRLTRSLARAFSASSFAAYSAGEELSHRQLMAFLLAYYESNGLYDRLSAAFREEGIWKDARKPIRNPTFPAVEFYPMTLWPGSLPDALPIVLGNDVDEAVKPAIEKVWAWSNFSQKKQLAARQAPLTGDLFLKVTTDATDEKDAERVFLQVIKSVDVTEFAEDEMGHVTMVRFEVSKMSQKGKWGTWTELWDEEGYKQWWHQRGFGMPIADLGTPDDELAPSDIGGGIDFVPWTHAQFRDTGDGWGLPLIMPAIDKIDEVNRKCTRLDQIMFRYGSPPWMVSANTVDEKGRPIPAPKLSDDDVVVVRDEEIFYMPGKAKIDFLIPNLQYGEYRARILEDLEEIRETLPEITYYQLIKEGAISGAALRYKMAPAISRAIEARGNGEAAIARADSMALEIGSSLKLEGFAGLGSFTDGDFEHRFAERDVIPLTAEERATTIKTYVDMGLNVAPLLVRFGGWSKDDAEAAAPTPAIEGLPEAQAAEQEAVIEGLVKATLPLMETAITAISDTSLQFLIDSGALEKEVAKAAGNGSEQAG